MAYSKEYFEKQLQQTYKNSIIDYKGELDGKLVFYIGVKTESFAFTDPLYMLSVTLTTQSSMKFVKASTS